ncbi:MAG: geranyl transferase [Gammaproteobacteria bacterium]|jgi:farnesyl diphosphate synthase|nr:geranyl transferase [Gammaproteobacteria bacterium]MBT7603082.1 geranyl transferase [Gammaproteobacteria bacterium]
MSNEIREFTEFKSKFTLRIQKKLEGVLSLEDNSIGILDAMRYSSLNGGKFIRALLVYSTADAFKINVKLLDQVAISIELIHAYSLIHDDLPSMDNDTIRRGVPSCHIAFSESTAILAGDALQALAFEILSENKYKGISDNMRLRWINYLSSSIGAAGIAGGQYLDLLINNKSTELEYLNYIYSLKTSSLIKSCIILPAMLTKNITKDEFLKLEEFASILGISFQIKDDLLGYMCSSTTLGKTQGKDEQRNQPNYINLLGLGKTEKKLEENKKCIDKLLKDLALEKSMLHNISNYIFNRSF